MVPKKNTWKTCSALASPPTWFFRENTTEFLESKDPLVIFSGNGYLCWWKKGNKANYTYKKWIAYCDSFVAVTKTPRMIFKKNSAKEFIKYCRYLQKICRIPSEFLKFFLYFIYLHILCVDLKFFERSYTILSCIALSQRNMLHYLIIIYRIVSSYIALCHLNASHCLIIIHQIASS